jgi:hypothetical protein
VVSFNQHVEKGYRAVEQLVDVGDAGIFQPLTRRKGTRWNGIRQVNSRSAMMTTERNL